MQPDVVLDAEAVPPVIQWVPHTFLQKAVAYPLDIVMKYDGSTS